MPLSRKVLRTKAMAVGGFILSIVEYKLSNIQRYSHKNKSIKQDAMFGNCMFLNHSAKVPIALGRYLFINGVNET